MTENEPNGLAAAVVESAEADGSPEVTAVGELAAQVAPAQAPLKQSAGQIIRQAREAAGVSLANLSASLKVSAKTIVALEEDNVSALPDLAFSRALASSICRTLKIDPAPVLATMPELPVARVKSNQEAGLNLPMGRQFQVTPSLTWLRSSTFLIVAAVALATLVVANWPSVVERFNALQQMVGMGPGAVKADQPSVEPVQTPLAANMVAEPVVVAQPVSGVASTPVAAPIGAVAVGASAPKAVAAVNSGSAPVPGAALQLVLKASSSSWVEITDAQGKPVWKKLLNRDEVTPVTVPAPARILVGNVAGTEVMVNGVPYNMAPVASNNIARFEIK